MQCSTRHDGNQPCEQLRVALVKAAGGSLTSVEKIKSVSSHMPAFFSDAVTFPAASSITETIAERFRRISLDTQAYFSMYSAGAWSSPYSGCDVSGVFPTWTA
jgi:hypothetical protein